MNVRTVLLLLTALAVAGVTAFVVDGWLAGQRAAVQATGPASPAPPPLQEVLVASSALPAGTFIKPEHLQWRPWPEEGVIEAHLLKGKVAEQDMIGAVVRSHLDAGEAITRSRVVHPGEQGFLAAVLEPGARAVSIPVDGASGVAGFVFPGDVVDVILTVKRSVPEEGSATPELRQFSETLLEAVRVLAIDQSLERGGDSVQIGKHATLQVSPQQAERVALALDMGKLTLSLRSLARDDAGSAPPSGRPGAAGEPRPAARSYARDTDVLFMIGDPMGLPPPAGMRSKVSVLRGSEHKEIRY